MEDPSETTTSCSLCSLLQFDDLAAGCREAVDEEGRARLSFEGAKVESRHSHRVGELISSKLIRLEWHLSDSLPYLPCLSISGRAGCVFCSLLRLFLIRACDAAKLSQAFILDGAVSLTAYISLFEAGIDGLVIELASNEIDREERSLRLFFPTEASLGNCVPLLLDRPPESNLTLSL